MAKELTNNGIREGKPKKKFKKLKIFGIIIASIILILSIVTISSYLKYKSEINSNSNGNIDGIQEYSYDGSGEGLQNVVIQANSSFDRKGSANPALRFRNKTTGNVDWYFDHLGKIYASNLNVTQNLTVTDYGFFQYLGSSVNKILFGWFDNINVSSTANASKFYQDGNIVIDSVSSVWNQSGTNVYLNNPAGNIGIGTSSPADKLSVNIGNISITGTDGLSKIQGFLKFISSASFPTQFSGISGITIPSAADQMQLAFYTSGNEGLATERMRITQNGDIGIGTTSPNQILEIGKNTTDGSTKDGLIRVTARTNLGGIRSWDFGATSSTFGFYIKDTGMSEPALSISYGTGNVGINTTSPSNVLDVNGIMRIDRPSIAQYGLFASDNYAGTHLSSSDGYFRFDKVGGEENPYITIIDGGNIGIGTTNPIMNLQVSGTGTQEIKVNSSNGVAQMIIDGVNASELYFSQGGADKWVVYHENSDDTLRFYEYTAPASTVMTMTNSGNIGIGTLEPGYLLDINGSNNLLRTYQTIGGGNSLTLSTSFGGGNNISLNPFISGVNNGGFEIKNTTTNLFAIIPNGNVGIGTTNPTGILDVRRNSNSGIYQYLVNADQTNNDSWVGMIIGQDDGADNMFMRYQTATDIAQIFNEGNVNSTFRRLELGVRNKAGVSNMIMSLQDDKVGIGTTSPAYLLELAGTGKIANFSDVMTITKGVNRVNISGDLFVNGLNISAGGSGVNYWGSNGSNIYNLTARIGIGVLAPAYQLEINNLANALNVSGMLYVNSTYVGIRNNNFVGTGWSDSALLGVIGNNVGSGAIGATYNLTGTSFGWLGLAGSGVYGSTAGYGYGVQGAGVGGSGVGVYGIGVGADTIGLLGESSLGYALVTTGKVNMIGNVNVTGNISSGNFMTDRRNVSIGFNAGNNVGGNNIGDYITAIGNQAGNSNTGGYITAIGNLAGNSNTGDEITAIGENAGNSNTGDYLTAIGALAGASNTGNFVTALGGEAGYANKANNSVYIGYKAGYRGTSSTINNTFLLEQVNANANPLIKGNFTSGILTCYGGAGCWATSSDKSLKTNITELNYGLNEILNLTAVRYNWKINNISDIGFIAQDVNKIIPEIVSGGDGDMKVAYGTLTPILTKAIQEQQNIINKQDETINLLKSELCKKDNSYSWC